MGRVRAAADAVVDENRLKCVRIFLIIFFFDGNRIGTRGVILLIPPCYYKAYTHCMYIVHTYIFISAAPRYHTVIAPMYSVYTLPYIYNTYIVHCVRPRFHKIPFIGSRKTYYTVVYLAWYVFIFFSVRHSLRKTTLAPITTALPVRPLSLTPSKNI